MNRQAWIATAWMVVVVRMLSACGGKTPERGTPEWTRKIRDGEIIVSAEDVPGTGLKVVTATGMTDLPPAAAWEVFHDVDNFKNFLWRLDDSKELPPQGDKRVITMTVNAPPIALTSGYDRITITAVVSESISEDGKVRRGDFQSIEGNIKNAYGAWVVEGLDNDQRSLVSFSMFIDFGKVVIPDDVANYFVADFLERWGNDLREYAQKPENRIKYEQMAAIRAGKDPNKVAPDLRNVGDFLR